MSKHSRLAVNTSRYGRKLPTKKYNDEIEIALKESISKIDSMLFPRSTTSTKSSSSLSVSNNTSVRNCTSKKTTTCDFSVGDLVWAKMGKYPIWPGIVINHPGLNMIYISKTPFVNYIYL